MSGKDWLSTPGEGTAAAMVSVCLRLGPGVGSDTRLLVKLEGDSLFHFSVHVTIVLDLNILGPHKQTNHRIAAAHSRNAYNSLPGWSGSSFLQDVPIP